MAIGERAFVLAAGLGQRMRPITLEAPKPLVKVGGKPLIAHVFDRLQKDGVAEAIVNVHHLPEQIETWCKAVAAPRITISDERGKLLDTGGGIAKALPLLGAEPFFVMNADSFWIEGKVPALERLRGAWRDDVMDCLLLLCDPSRTTGYDGNGDFVRGGDGRLTRARLHPEKKALAYIGAYLVHPRIFRRAPDGPFSMNRLWDEAIAGGRLYGLAHEGHWLHVGTAASIAAAEDKLRSIT